MPVSIYDTITMLEAIKLMPPLPTFLWDTFVNPNGRFSATEVAEIDYKKGTRRMAPFVESDVGGIVMARDGFDTALIKFPTIAPERLIRKQDLLTRSMGESPYSAMNMAQREAVMLRDDLNDLREAIRLRWSWMVAQLLFATPGRLSLDVMTDKGLAVDALRVDYGFTNNITVTMPWTNPAATPMTDLEIITDAARDTGGENPSIILMDSASAAAYRNNPTVQSAMDIRNFQFGSLAATYSGDYLKFLGISPNGLEMYAYTAAYLADDGTSKPMMPAGTVAALSKGCVDVIWGPVLQLEPGDTTHTMYMDSEVPMYLPDYKKNTTGLRLTSRPMIFPENVDGWAVANVL